jgi:hypothetical protein
MYIDIDNLCDPYKIIHPMVIKNLIANKLWFLLELCQSFK